MLKNLRKIPNLVHLFLSSTSSKQESQIGKMGEEIPSSKRRKIEETVLNILKDADLETATESSVRTTASQQLDTDFSDLASKIFIRQVVESFLLSNAPSTTTPDHAGNNNKVSVPEETKAPSTTTPGDAGNKKVSVPEGTKLGEVGKKDPEFGRHICNVSLTLVLNFIFIFFKKKVIYIMLSLHALLCDF